MKNDYRKTRADKSATVAGRGLLICFLLIVVFLGEPAVADVYKCISSDGTVKYSDQPCGDKAEVTVHTQGLDDLITLASPYTQAVVNPDRISFELLTLSRKIGDRILPNERFYGQNVRVENDRPDYWEIHLWYAPVGFTEWEIIMDYAREPDGNTDALWLISIAVKRWGKPYSPPAMDNVKKMRKTRPGVWVRQP